MSAFWGGWPGKHILVAIRGLVADIVGGKEDEGV